MLITDFVFLKDSKDKSKYHKIQIADICYISANGDYVSINTKERRYVVYGTLISWEEILPKELFFRVSRSNIIQIALIQSVDSDHEHLTINNQVVPIGDSYKKQFFSKFTFI